MIFRQMQDKESGTFTYLLADPNTREAILIDPVVEQVDRDRQLLRDLDLKLTATLETHVHADHVTGAGELRKCLGSQVIAGAGTRLTCADRLLEDGEKWNWGNLQLTTLATPGHTDGCTSYYFRDRVFTGDALLIRGCGRTDFQQGSSERLFESVRKKLFSLPDETLVYPGHDYKGWMCSSIGEEKAHNPRLGLDKSLEEFVSIMKSLNLPPPKKLEESLPRNMNCGF